MPGSDFLAAVRKAMPDRDELEDYGLDDEEIDAIQSTFSSRARVAKPSPEESASELERMILDNDCSTVEIGLVRFLERPRPHSEGVAVAYCEANMIVVRADGSVSLYDHAAPATVAMECAASSEAFLDGLAAFVEIRANKSDWMGRPALAAQHCSAQAGGSAYMDFFATLCGFLV